MLLTKGKRATGWRSIGWQSMAAKLRKVWPSREADREFEEEIEIHIRMLAERFVRRGMAEDKAWSQARREFGNRTVLKESRHEMLIFARLETLWQDLRYSLRTLARSKGFSVIALLH